MIDKININPTRFDPDKSGPDQPGRPKSPVNQQTDATLQITCHTLMEQAVKMPASDTDAVQKAQELLRTGQLDTPANIRQAAENIVRFGI
jgi:hypothetical protein